MKKRNPCLFLRMEISLIAHFDEPIFVEFLLFLFLPISSVYWFFALKIT